jgi:hypothetical protein
MAVRIKLAGGLCVIGAVAMFASLLMPWYGPANAADYLTIFGSSQAVDFFSGRHSPDGWQALSAIDIYLAGLSAATLLTSALTLRRSARATSFALTGVGALVAVGLIVYRLVEPAAPFNVPSIVLGARNDIIRVDFLVDPRFGIFVALGGAISILVGSTALVYGTAWPRGSSTQSQQFAVEDHRVAK